MDDKPASREITARPAYVGEGVMINRIYKGCTACGEVKQLDEFHKRPRSRHGRRAQCKSCIRKKESARRRNTDGRHREYNRRWAKENPERVATYFQQYRHRNPDKKRAHRRVWDAVRQGKLVKPDACENCMAATEKAKLHAHHEDYSRPLEVEWLCQECHEKRHHPELWQEDAS